MKEHRVDSIKGIRAKEAQAEFNARDYRVLKQIEKIPEIRAMLEEEYPDEIAWREEMRKKIRELRGEGEEEATAEGEGDG